MSSPQQIRSEITQQIVEAIRQGGLPPWKQPWAFDANAGRPCNVESGRPYNGINVLLLNLSCRRFGFRSRWWATLATWNRLGGRIRKRPPGIPSGSWGTRVVYAAPVSRTSDDVAGDDDEARPRRGMILRQYTVFNVEQVEGDFEHLLVGNAPLDTLEIDRRFEHAEEAIRATGARIIHGGNEAYYLRDNDTICLPHRHRFERPEFYYEVAGHELVHWSECPERLNWDRESNGYAAGELIAEIGSAFWASALSLPSSDDLGRHCSYLGHWLEQMQADPGYLFRAAAQGSRAVDYLLSFRRPAIEEQVAEPELVA